VRWGAAELERLTSALKQESLFYWNGSQTAALLKAFHQHYPLKYIFACSSGTASIHIAIASLRLRPGDEVIVPPITDMGSVIGILYQQGVPVFADIDPRTYNLDPEAVRRAITSRTKAIVAVHLAGNPCDLTTLVAIAREHRLALVEDCAQAWGAEHHGTPVGLWGDFGCYSFNDYKHLSCGDGGIVATNREDYGLSLGKWGDKSYDRVAGQVDPALLRNPADLAPNYRISELQSAVAAAQLPKLTEITARRHRSGERLSAALAVAPGILTPLVHPGDTHSYWFYLLRLDLPRIRVDRGQFVAALRAEGVEASAGYIPMPVYRYRVFQNHNFFGGTWPVRNANITSMDYRQVTCPVAEGILADSVMLPLNEAMGDHYIDLVACAITAVAQRLAR
jgi:dTDP-4-amino-4,6-dideoxygalactose transaminase